MQELRGLTSNAREEGEGQTFAGNLRQNCRQQATGIRLLAAGSWTRGQNNRSRAHHHKQDPVLPLYLDIGTHLLSSPHNLGELNSAAFGYFGRIVLARRASS